MRLRELAQRLSVIVGAMERVRFDALTLSSGEGGFHAKGLRRLAEVLVGSESLPLTPHDAELLSTIRQHPALLEGQDEVRASSSVLNNLRSFLKEAQVRLSALRAAVLSVVPPPTLGQFAIRLPKQHSGLDNLAADVKELSLLLEQPLRRVLGTELEVVGLDRGTDWVEVRVVVAEAITLITMLMGAWGALNKLRAAKQKEDQEARVAVEKAALDARRLTAEARKAEGEARRAEAEAAAAEEVSGLTVAIARLHKIQVDQWIAEEADRIIAAVVTTEDVRVRMAPDAVPTLRAAIRQGADAVADKGIIVVRELGPGERTGHSLPSLGGPPAEARQLEAGAKGEGPEGEGGGTPA